MSVGKSITVFFFDLSKKVFLTEKHRRTGRNSYFPISLSPVSTLLCVSF